MSYSHYPPPPLSSSSPGQFVTTETAADDTEGNDDITSSDAVGFESTTVLTGRADGLADRGGVAQREAERTAGSSPFALYEPLHTQHLQGIHAAASTDAHSMHYNGSMSGGGGGGGAQEATLAVLGGPSAGSSGSLSILGEATSSVGVLSPTPAPKPVPYVEEGLEVPLHAPRLRVPTDLPLEQTTLLDLLALAVVQGGPTTEEEIVKREMPRRNPAFAFLGEKFNHPCLLYYRWRLYSLLQQGTLLAWRTAPFQVEQARRAYVFVPPPVLRVGPECLACLHEPHKLLQSPSAAGGGEEGNAKDDEEGEEIAVRRKAHSGHGKHRHHSRHRREKHRREESGDEEKEDDDEDRQSRRQRTEREGGERDRDAGGRRRHRHRRSNSGSSRGRSASSSTSRSSSSGSEHSDKGGEEETTGSSSPPSHRRRRHHHHHHQDSTAAVEEADGAEKSTAADHNSAHSHKDGHAGAAASDDVGSRSDAHESAEAFPAVPLPPPSAQWISRQCALNKHVFTVLQPGIVQEWTRLLNPRRICNPQACASVEELSARWLARDEIARRMAFAVEHADGIYHLLSLLLDAVVKAAYVATAFSRSPLPPSAEKEEKPSSVADDSSVFCVEVLFYLFVLHDIVMNASNMPQHSDEVRGADGEAAVPCCVNKNPRRGASASPASVNEEEDISGGVDDFDALYAALKQQQQQLHHHQRSSPLSGASTSGSSASGSSFHPSPQSPTAGHSAVALTAMRQRRRKLRTRRRSPYERCGDALELILPTLLEACTAVALAVSMDKERQPAAVPPPPPPTAAAAITAAAPQPRAHHFKVLPPAQARKQQKKAAGDGLTAASAVALPATVSSASLSLRLDACCDAAPGPAQDSTATAPPPTSSAPAVMLVEWLRSLLLVWMHAEQPLKLPLPVGPSHRHMATDAEDSTAAPLPPGLMWPETKAGATDAPEVQLAYHVRASQAHLLGLEAAATHGSAPGLAPHHAYAEEPREPPLLSARACAILKDRYAFLF